MTLPFVSRRFHESITMVLTDYSDKLERRVKDLEAERRILLDHISMLQFGKPIYELPAPPQEQTEAETDRQPPEPTIRRRPSHIMRHQDRLAEEAWLRKTQPARAAAKTRDEVMQQFDHAHTQGEQAALKS